MKKVGNTFVQSCHFCPVGWVETHILYARNIPGDALAITFFHAQALLSRIAMLFLSQSIASNPQVQTFRLRLQAAYCTNHPKTNTAITWSFWRDAHCLEFCNILGARSNKLQNQRLACMLVNTGNESLLCIVAWGPFFSSMGGTDFLL